VFENSVGNLDNDLEIVGYDQILLEVNIEEPQVRLGKRAQGLRQSSPFFVEIQEISDLELEKPELKNST
jgi:hypothetical protein